MAGHLLERGIQLLLELGVERVGDLIDKAPPCVAVPRDHRIQIIQHLPGRAVIAAQHFRRAYDLPPRAGPGSRILPVVRDGITLKMPRR